MKLTVPSKISVLLTNIRKWRIEVYGDYRRFYKIYFTPALMYKDWSATRMTQGVDGEFIETHEVKDYQLTVAFLTAYATVALKKDIPL